MKLNIGWNYSLKQDIFLKMFTNLCKINAVKFVEC